MAPTCPAESPPERSAVADYVSRRLKRETSASRGVAAEIARKTGFTSAHVANAKNWGTVGADFEIAMADYWGMTVGELRAAAAAEASAGLAPFEAAAARVDGIVAPETIAALRENPPAGAEAMTEQEWVRLLVSPDLSNATPITQAKARRDTSAAVARTSGKAHASKAKGGQ